MSYPPYHPKKPTYQPNKTTTEPTAKNTAATGSVSAYKPIPAARPEQQARVKYGEERMEEFHRRWGDGPDEAPYTLKVYEQMQRNYDSLASEYKGAITPRLEMALIDLARLRYLRDEEMRKGNGKDAKTYQEMIDKVMTGEAMKAGDAKPTEKFAIDSLATRLEARGLMDNGVLILENVIDYIRNDHGVYHMSKDAIDMCLLSMLNAIRFNNGLSELTELPEDMKVQDKFGEFLPEPTQDEKNAMMEFGMALQRK